MSQVLFKRKTTNEIENLPIVDGQLIYNVENGNTYMDYEESRIQTGRGGNSNYSQLENKPQINGIELNGNKSLNDLGINNFSGNYNDLTNKPTIPTKTSDLNNDTGFITSSYHDNTKVDKVDGKGLSSNDYTTSEKNKLAGLSNYNDTEVRNLISAKYTKPSSGIPKTDLTSAVQTSLEKADSALQSYTETDPIFSASVASGITSTDINNWNNKSTFSGNYNDLTNKPTIPIVPTTLSSFTDDLGSSPTHTHSQYLTSHQDISGKLDTSKVKNANSTTAGDVYDVTYINTMLGNIETLLGGI